MDEQSVTTTEVQIRKSLSYLPHLHRIVSCIASRLGMSRKDVEETKKAVSEVCANSINAASDGQDGRLSIKLSTQGEYMMVEITDPCMNLDAVRDGGQSSGGNGHSGVLERIRHLMDSVELIGGDVGATIRITKCARKPARTPAKPAPYLGVLGTTTLQS